MAQSILQYEKLLASDGSKRRICVFAVGNSPGANGTVFAHHGTQVDTELRHRAPLIVFDEFKDSWVSLELDSEHEVSFPRWFPRVGWALIKGEPGVVNVSMTDPIACIVQNLNPCSSDWL